jgi:mRNA interferase RelE/StbE
VAATYPVEFERAAARALKRLDESVRRRVLAALADDPRPAGAEMLSGSESLFRIRVGDYRVIYAIEDDRLVVLVLHAGHRPEVYRKLARRLTRRE